MGLHRGQKSIFPSPLDYFLFKSIMQPCSSFLAMQMQLAACDKILDCYFPADNQVRS